MYQVKTMAFDKDVARTAICQSPALESYDPNSLSVEEIPDGDGGYGSVFRILSSKKPIGKVIKVAKSKKFSKDPDKDSNTAIFKEIGVFNKVKENGSHNIVHVYDSGKVSYYDYEIYYYVAEELFPVTVDGENETLSVKDIFSSTNSLGKKHFNEELAYLFIIDLTQALCDIKRIYNYNNENVNTVHRDIKLKNIMYAQNKNGRRIFKLIDFGNFKAYEGDVSISDTGNATPFFMAPERMAGKSRPANDIFSLACVLYQLLSINHKELSDKAKRTDDPFLDAKVFLDDLYGVSVIDFYEGKVHTENPPYPPENLFDENHLLCSSDLSNLLRSMMCLDYKQRPSAEKVQAEILRIINNHRAHGMSVEDFEDCSGYALYQTEHSIEIERMKKARSNTQSIVHHKSPQIKKKIATTKEKEGEKKDKRNILSFVPAGLIAFWIIILPEALLSIGLSLLPLINYSFYCDFIHYSTGPDIAYSADKTECFVFPFLAVLISRIIILPMAYRRFVSSKYRFRIWFTNFVRISGLIMALLAAIGMGIYDSINFFGNFQLSTAPFLIRRLINEGVTIAICVIGFSTISGIEKHRPFLQIKQRVRYKTHIVFSIGLIVPLLFLIVFSITPTFKFLYNETIKEMESESYSIFDSIQEDDSESNTIEEEYSEAIYWTDEQKKEYVDHNTEVLTYVSLVLLYLVIIILPFYFLRGYANYEERFSLIRKARFRLAPNSYDYRSNNSISFSWFWKDYNWSRVIEIEADSVGLTSDEVSLIAKGIKKAETDESGKYKKDENGKTIIKHAGIETLTKVNLDHNDINELIEPWNSHNITDFSCSGCHLTSLEGLRTLGVLEVLDLHDNEISSLQFLLQSRANLTLRELDVSDNYIPQEEFDSVLSNCINLERLSIAQNSGPNSLEFIRNMNHLISLNVAWGEIYDLSPLLGKSFISLSLINCELEDIAVLGEGIIDPFADEPVDLDLRGNHITDISALPTMEYKNLRLSYNPISDFSHLQYFSGDTLEVSFSGDWDFLDQLDYMNGFRHIIIQQVSLEAEGHIRRKLENKLFDISTDPNNPYITEPDFD